MDNFNYKNKLISLLLLDGPVVYAAYLKMEHSDENIKFWMACETYKKIASRWSRISMAKKLYKTYIQPQSPREVTKMGNEISASFGVNICQLSIHARHFTSQYILKCYKFGITNLFYGLKKNLRIYKVKKLAQVSYSGNVSIQI